MAIKGTGIFNQTVRWNGATYSGCTNISIIVWAKSEYFTNAATYCDIFGKFTPGTLTYTNSISAGTASISVGKLVFIQGFSGTSGSWITTNSVFSSNVLYQFIVTYNNSSTTNDPIFYFNGTSVSVTDGVVPVGTATMDNAGDKISVLAQSTDYPSNKGEIYGVAVFSRILSATDASVSYAAGVSNFNQWVEQNSTSLVFNPNLEMAQQILRTNFVGSTLTSSNLIVDRVTCNTGVPIDSPLGA